jgi:SAM-dependent methyltransferase
MRLPVEVMKPSTRFAAGAINLQSRLFSLSSSPSPSSLMATTTLAVMNHTTALLSTMAGHALQSTKHHISRQLFPSTCGRYPTRYNSSSSTTTSSSSTSKAFDRTIKQQQRDNAARARKLWRQSVKGKESDDTVDYEYFRQEMALRLVDRLDDIRRAEGFPLALDLGCGVGHLYRAISSDDAFEGPGGIGGVRKMVLLDSSKEMLHVDDELLWEEEEQAKNRCEAYKLHADEEDKLPFPDGTFDLVLSSQSLHWVNDLPNVFKEVFRVLKPDGCFMFSMIGGATLPELRIALTLAELERNGGVGTHVGPFVELSDVGALMQNAGFALPTIDIDTVEISYPNGTNYNLAFL